MTSPIFFMNKDLNIQEKKIIKKYFISPKITKNYQDIRIFKISPVKARNNFPSFKYLTTTAQKRQLKSM